MGHCADSLLGDFGQSPASSQQVKSLEDQAEDTKKQAATMLSIVRDLEASIAKYKKDYALLIRETEA